MDATGFDPPPGDAVPLAPGLVRVVAPNPGPMTFRGTNTYLLGRREIAVIDPGPDDPGHLQAILAAVPAGGTVTQILVTHAHADHSALAPRLAAATGAPVAAHGDAEAGRSAAMRRLAAAGIAGGGEGVDRGFTPDLRLADGEAIDSADWRLSALRTPGHMGDHLCFLWDGTVFTGDLVMRWASTLISPPDGDVADFRASCRRLRALAPAMLWPGHGAPVDDPAARIDALLAHRQAREAAIRAALAEGPATPAALADRVYADTPAALRAAARRNLLAHLVDLVERGAVRADPAPGIDATFRLAAPARGDTSLRSGSP